MSLEQIGNAVTPNTTSKHIFKFGFNAAVGTTQETVWLQGAAYNWLGAATVLQVSSSDADDTSAGAGARTIILEGLDASYDELSETVTMNGQTKVPTVGSFLRVHRAYAVTSGASNTNEGTIYVYTGDETNGVPDTATAIHTTIGPSAGQTLQSFYTIPAGHTGYLSKFHASSFGNANNFATVDLRFRTEGGPWRVQDRVIVSRSLVTVDHDIPLSFPEKSDIEIVAAADGATVDLSTSFSLMLDIN